MTTHDAILKAADQIEQHPSTYDFCETEIPNACGSPGCALGWIGHFAGQPADALFDAPYSFSDVAFCVLGIPSELRVHGDAVDVFYRRMDKFGDWQFNATVCARALRLYAAKYHAAVQS